MINKKRKVNIGEVTDMMLEGILCQECVGVVDDSIEEVPGYPVTCEDCKPKENEKMTLLDKAFKFALEKHHGQYRKGSGIPYFTHVVEVMKLLSRITTDEEVLCAAILHDYIEDCDLHLSIQERFNILVAEFGQRVAEIVLECSREGGDDVTKRQKYEFLETFGKKSFESILLKICDRFCNVTDYFNDGKKKYCAKHAAQAYPLYRTYFAREDKVEFEFDKGKVNNLLDVFQVFIAGANYRVNIFEETEMMYKKVESLVINE